MFCLGFRAFSCGSWGEALGIAPLDSFDCVSSVASRWCEVGFTACYLCCAAYCVCCAAYCGLPVDPRQASTSDVSLCTYERWFAAEPAAVSYCNGGWSSVPEYVSRTAGIPHAHVRSLAAFRLGAHSFEIATGRWCNRPRSQRLCQLCGTGVGDEFHVVFECPCQDVPRQLHVNLFDGFGGWSSLGPAGLPDDAMRLFMAQDSRSVASLSMHVLCVHKRHHLTRSCFVHDDDDDDLGKFRRLRLCRLR